MAWNSNKYETELIQEFRRALVERLPTGWEVYLQPDKKGAFPDAALRLTGPDGKSSTIAIEVKTRIEPAQIRELQDRLSRINQSQWVVLSPYVSPRAREMLREAGGGYMDLTGNMWVTMKRPAVFIDAGGANRSPLKSDRSLRSLKGPAAGRVVRALCDFRPPFGIRELAERSRCTAASVSRVVAVLEQETLIERNGSGRVDNVDWAGTIRRWSQDYSFNRSNRVQSYLAPRGWEALSETLRSIGFPYACTGAMAAPSDANVMESRLVQIYTNDRALLAERLEIRIAEVGANVQLAEPFDPVVYERGRVRGDLNMVGPSQCAADLLTGPGRNPAEAENLLKWMGANESNWRR